MSHDPLVDADAGRRSFLKRLATLLGCFLAGAAGVPLVGAALAPAARRGGAQTVALGAAADFPTGEPRMITFGVLKADGYLSTTLPRAVWVRRLTDGRIDVFNARCTHLGCLISYRPDSQTFLSPCHGGVFALSDGAVLEGPPPRPLDRLEARVENGQVVVDYRDFLVGVPDRVPL